ncbi:autophagy protein 13 [Aspergillus fumigatus]|nr:autophagy protein 13 [Aspergillus fumigatus]
MHQHPRSPAPAAPTSSTRSNRSTDHRELDTDPSSPSSDVRMHNGRGLGIEPETEPSEQVQRNTQPAKEAMAKLNQIITFNVEIEDTDILREQLRIWRTCDAIENRPPPLIIETYLETKGLTNNQSLVILDENGKRWDVLEALTASGQASPVRPPHSNSDDVILERWRVELGSASSKPPSDLGSILPTVYKKSIVLFRSLFTYSKFLPAWKFAKRNGRLRSNPALQIRYRILDGRTASDRRQVDHLTVPLYEGNTKVVETYSFGVTDSPAGPFSVEVTYRTNCDFRVDDSEALLSSRFMGADDEIFRPSFPSRDANRRASNAEPGSAPLEKRTVEEPDPGRAYGSLSTFHHVGPATGASPISALRAARESVTSSPSPPSSASRRPLSAARAAPTGRAAALAAEASPSPLRRPSISFQPFKAPPLSASPSLIDPPLGASPRSRPIVSAPSSEPKHMPPPSVAASGRKTGQAASENAIASSNSASPRPAPIARYSSAFSHRRGRPSSGGINKIEDDASSGKASATSSGAQPGSGLLAEVTGTSADSLHADDENISEFLKMLDLRKDLLSPSNLSNLDAVARRTTVTSAALTRFQRMRDSNAALSESMSSSLLLQRSSNASSKQLSGVPPMVAGASVSTASSPGKPISPHTPHTPAIPSRLSSNSIVDYNDHGHSDGRLLHGGPTSLPEDTTGEETALVHRPPTVTAIDIPTSPRLFPPTYRRSSSAAQNRRSVVADEEEIFPFNMRSVSLGAEERTNVSLSTLHRRHEYHNAATNPEQQQESQRASSSSDQGPTALPSPAKRETRSQGDATVSGQTPDLSSSANHNLYQPRLGQFRSRGSFGGAHSLSSGSSSLARGGGIPTYLTERDNDRDGNASGSNSGNSTTEERRGFGRRVSAGRNYPPHPSQVEEDEPLLFAMSDFGASRRSFEEGRQGNHGADFGGSRRGSGRRGAGVPGFHVWS